ncbi:hypothetical protein H257_10904 [Aphanomyces astaci]|uniref:Uncharacterized protein n=1 Tax=Aphanomyces astaci TaxID=112090 RepID=W4G599_APHAT|nr:hypothetical protein H257_10904 [Aphanomyces astaci]ETV74865.1 hypothetical protein H257_10904 [Aphanomyces astaci]|eukprot:XP_009835952.1 hypothetical protein H257_10904 [Aphanomyces astaci]
MSLDCTQAHPRNKRSTSAATLSLKLFLDDGFIMDMRSLTCRDDVLRYGVNAEQETLAFLLQHEVRSRGSSAALKALQKIHRSGALNARIAHYHQLIASGMTTCPAPPATHDILEEMAAS